MLPQLVKKRKNKKPLRRATDEDRNSSLTIRKSTDEDISFTSSPLTEPFTVDYFEDGTIKKKIFLLLDEAFFDYNDGEFKSSSICVFSDLCKEHQARKCVSPMKILDTVRISRESNEVFIKKFLEEFFPTFKPETRNDMQKNIHFTITGIIRALHSSLQFSNLNEQMKTIFFTSENYIKFFEEKFPYLTKIEPFPIPPLNLPSEDKEWIEETLERVILVKEYDFVPLFFILALFTPVDEDFSAVEMKHILNFHQKVINLIYSHLISRFVERH